MARLVLFIVGAVAFVALHVLFVATWQTWFHGSPDYAPWFMNSPGTVAFTAVVFALLNMVAAVCSRDSRIEPRLSAAAIVAGGATIPMIVISFTMPGGPGTIFPIVIVTGASIVFLSGAAGGWLGWAVRVARPRRHFDAR